MRTMTMAKLKQATLDAVEAAKSEDVSGQGAKAPKTRRRARPYDLGRREKLDAEIRAYYDNLTEEQRAEHEALARGSSAAAARMKRD